MRVFACSLLGAAHQAAYGRHVATMVSLSRGALRPIPRDSAHVTYAFVSDAAAERAPDLVTAIAEVAVHHESLVIRLGTPFVLYGGSEARLVCAPVTYGLPALSRLASDVVVALKAVLAGEAISASRSHHVTLARFRKKTRRVEARPVERALARSALVVPEERIARLQLMSSALTPDGPVYAPLVDVPLGCHGVSRPEPA